MLSSFTKFRNRRRSNKSQPPEYSRLDTTTDGQSICAGCRRIETLVDAPYERAIAEPLCFHNRFAELEACARHCMTCRVFRQGVLMRQPTARDADGLRRTSPALAIHVSVSRMPGTLPAMMRLKVTVGEPNTMEKRAAPGRVAWFSCTDAETFNCLNLSDDPRDPSIARCAKDWLAFCDTHHGDTCGNLRWSTRNPTRLLRLLTDPLAQLVDGAQDEVMKYVALSYCWGNATGTEESTIEQGETTRANFEQRSKPFSTSELPIAIREAIGFIRTLDIEYVWVDSLCIIQDDPTIWAKEAALMHEVYGNSSLCLALSSGEKASDSFFQPRDAWSLRPEPCQLSRQWIANLDLPLGDIQTHSPLSKRGWALGEQYLSPKILYWTSQRIHWSCAILNRSETALQPLRPPVVFSEVDRIIAPVQSFLLDIRQDKSPFIHTHWLLIVESFLQRDLTYTNDRFPALSGLAARYLQAGAADGEEYLAGLWRQTLPKDLGWAPLEPIRVGQDDSLFEIAPSWSWASLPMCTLTTVSPSPVPSTNLPSVGCETLCGRPKPGRGHPAGRDGQTAPSVRTLSAVHGPRFHSRAACGFQPGRFCFCSRRAHGNVALRGHENWVCVCV